MSYFSQDPMNIHDFSMSDAFEYDTPDQIPEWEWIEKNASFRGAHNGDCGVWDFIVNVDMVLENNPPKSTKLLDILNEAHNKSIKCILFNQGT